MGPKVYIVSDSIGETAETVVQAAASQFNSGKVQTRKFSYIQSEEDIKKVIFQARREPKCLIAYTLVKPGLSEMLDRYAKDAGILCVDIMGPMLDAFSKIYEKKPKQKAGLLHRLDKEYFARVDAIEFTVKYDDRNDGKGILLADVVLIGVSRTSKTPMSIYLAYKGLKAANIPLVPEVEPPKELFENPDGKVVGLTIDPHLLTEIRLERLRSLGLDTRAQYASIQRINEELEYAEKIMKRIGCPVVDVTNRSIEESANEVLRLIGR
ncbi:phosphoenolpyruvate synthase regulatory protein [Anoxybacter fermentans]|uniref:Putative pyruvate, phosphate dikinase regulatory protein n=1 Tax=Anoxybacter fermentans TaxID=1323375 RepID=A0A3Q9HQ23_9FIRM|nr:pyruvate, water dikinase regulatory protein [Anoxybacter fermentans]AZR73144.1 phosphoenolpyruvate synthase regulatory protein [Anoxybacter fermentans]